MESSKAPTLHDSRLRQMTARDRDAKRLLGKEERLPRSRDCRRVVPLVGALKPSGLAWLTILPIVHFCS